MRIFKIKAVRALLAVTVTVIVVLPIAIAGAKGGATPSRAGKAPKQLAAAAKQVKSLKSKMAQFAKVRAELAQQVAALQTAAGVREGEKLPTSAPPSGPAGGALTGTYPNPSLAPNSVRAPNIIDGEVSSQELADRSITAADLANGSVGGLDIKNTLFVASDPPVKIRAFETKQSTATCPGDSRLVSGGFEWTNGRNHTTIVSSGPDFQHPNKTWSVFGRVDHVFAGENTENELIAEALCLEE